jgi:hypothetical protein
VAGGSTTENAICLDGHPKADTMKHISARALALLASITCALALCACQPDEWRQNSLAKTVQMDAIFKAVPAELHDCKASALELKNGSYFYLVRCPNSSTSSQWQNGKEIMSSLVVDGVSYAPISQQAGPEKTAQPATEAKTRTAPDRLTINGVTYVRSK